MRQYAHERHRQQDKKKIIKNEQNKQENVIHIIYYNRTDRTRSHAQCTQNDEKQRNMKQEFSTELDKELKKEKNNERE